MARKGTRRARMARTVPLGVTIRQRPADLQREVMRLAEALPADCLARAFQRIKVFLDGKR